VLGPERPAEDLVPGGPVVEQRVVLAHVRLEPGRGEGAGDHRGLPRAGRGQAVVVAARDVRTRVLQRADEQLVGVAHHDVVAVDERDVVAACVLGARVAGVPETTVGLLDEVESLVALGEPPGDAGTGVSGPVVDHHDVELAVGLLRERLEAVGEVALDVVDGDDDAEQRHGQDPRERSSAAAAPAAWRRARRRSTSPW